MAKYKYRGRIIEAATKQQAVRKIVAETTYEINYADVEFSELARLGLGCGDVDEMKVAYGRPDLLEKLQWFVDNGIEVRGVDARRSNSTYDDVSGAYRKYIGKSPRARKSAGGRG